MSDFKELVQGFINIINEGETVPKADDEKEDGYGFSTYFGNSTKYEKKYIDKTQAKFWYSKLYGADKNFYNDPDLKKEFKFIDFSKDQPVAIYTDKGVKHIIPFILTKQGKIKWMVDCDYDINDKKAVPDNIRNIVK